MITSSSPSAATAATSTEGPTADGMLSPEWRSTRSTPAAVSSSAPAQAEKPADQPLTDTLNGPTVTPYHGKNAAINETAAPATTARSSVLRLFQSNRISPPPDPRSPH